MSGQQLRGQLELLQDPSVGELSLGTSSSNLWSIVLNGLVIQGGTEISVAAGSTTVIPLHHRVTRVLHANAQTITGSHPDVYIDSLTTTDLTVHNLGGIKSFVWMVIGT